MGLKRSRFLTPVAVAGALACLGPALGTAADDPSPKADAPAAPAAAPAKAKKMKMDQPMAGGMKKEGMMKGDMKKAAERKQRDMKDVMKTEEKAMKKEDTSR